MRESVIYQEILHEGELKGRQEEFAALVLRLLTKRFGPMDETVRSQLDNLPLPILEDLAEAVLEFSTLADVINWLNAHQ